MTKRVILWTTPRSLSSVFYRSISTLSYSKCWFELLAGPYYFGPIPDRQCSNFEPNFVPDGLECEPTYAVVEALLLKEYPRVDLVFSKEMAFCLPEPMRQEILEADIIHTFLIREPERAVYSHYKVIAGAKNYLGYDGLDIQETLLSYRELLKLYNLVKEHLGRPPVVINAADLQAYPDELMKNYCDTVGIRYEPHMTTWEPCPVPGPDIWVEYHRELKASSGFIRIKPEDQKPVPLEQLPKEVVQCIDECCPSYEAMLGACIKPYS